MPKPSSPPTNTSPAAQLLAALRALGDTPDLSGLSSEDKRELSAYLERLRGHTDNERPLQLESEALRQREQAARVYFDYALTGILETDERWLIQVANPAAASITGHEIKALQGRSLLDLISQDSAASTERHLSLLSEQGINQSEWRLTRRDGLEIIIEIASIQVSDDHFIHVFDDVSVPRRAAAELEKARQTAEAANRAKSEFLANISHEIRTPMNGIIGLSQLTLMTELSAQQRDYLEKIAQSGRSLLQIINDLLDYAKIEAGRMEFERIHFSLDELLDEVATLAAQVPADKDLEIVFHVSADIPRQLIGDRLRLGQCLSNLLSNAIKFTPAGRVELQISHGGLRNGKTLLDFAVADTGIGIAPEALSRLFQPFSQADAGTTRRFGGTGLGLVIARELARGMDGELRVESQVGIGSRFILELPFNIPASPAPPETPGAHAGHALLLTCRDATRAAVSEMLSSLGWKVTPIGVGMGGDVPSLDGGLLSQTPDLILVDCTKGLPRIEALRSRMDAERPPALLILTSAGYPESHLPGWEDHRRSLALTQPLTPNALKRALHHLDLMHGPAMGMAVQNEIPLEFQGAHILVAEDNPVNQVVLVDLLRRAGIHTTLARNGREAIDCLAGLAEPPDLVLMDVQMPQMDGLEATRTLRARGFNAPIIGVSAGARRAEQSACLEAGMSDFLPKPIDTDELWGTLTRWVQPRDHESAVHQAVETAEERFLNDHASLKQAIAAFLERHRHDARQLEEHLLATDTGGMAAVAHSLKGAAATIGAEAVATLAGDVERQVHAGVEAESMRQLIRELDAALTDFVARHPPG